MIYSIVSTDNSKGIRLHKAILGQDYRKKDIALEIENDWIIIKPIPKKARKDWAHFFKKMEAKKEDQLIIDDTIDLNIEGWVG